jgi:ATPase subunit of ABC transporter with duplicated ATPase domains
MFGFGRRLSEVEIREEWATRAVADVPAEMEETGATTEEAYAVAEAVKLMVLADSYEQRARQALSDAGFNSSMIDRLIASMRSGLM